MEKQDIINYVLTTPENTNPAILEGMLEQLIAQSGGGGGESDLTTANVTIANDTSEEYQTVYLPFCQEAAGDVAPATTFPMLVVTNDASQDVKAVLYKGACMGRPESESVTVEVTGDITIEHGTFIITGDGTITLTNTQN